MNGSDLKGAYHDFPGVDSIEIYLLEKGEELQ